MVTKPAHIDIASAKSTTGNAVGSPLCEYRHARAAFFARHASRWPGTLYDPFDILAPRAITRGDAREIFEATDGVAHIYRRAAELLRRLPSAALVEMGVPDHMQLAVGCGISGIPDCLIGRVDLAHTNDGYKLLEFNAEAPGLVVEAFSVNGHACRDAGSDDPNSESEERFRRALASSVRAGVQYVENKQQRANVVVTSSDGPRDRAQANYVCKLLAEFSAEYFPVEDLHVNEEGIFDLADRRIDVLYRSFPLQYMQSALSRSEKDSGQSTTPDFILRLVEMRRLALINPPFSYLLENKGLQALIWNLFEVGSFFDEFDRRLIQRYMLPTYFDPSGDVDMYIMKPLYGAQGDSTKIINSDGLAIEAARLSTFSDQPMIFQKYAELEEETIMTEYGPRRLHLVTSCFLISGTTTGICMRAGQRITDDSAWVLPVCLSP